MPRDRRLVFSTVEKSAGQHPPQIGAAVRCKRGDVEMWLNSCPGLPHFSPHLMLLFLSASVMNWIG